MRKALITGTSRGSGRSLAKELTGRGDDVIATARHLKDINDVNVFQKLSLDVADETQVKNSLKSAEQSIYLSIMQLLP